MNHDVALDTTLVEDNPQAGEQEEDNPGAYPVPFRFRDVEAGRRLDSIPDDVRYWGAGKTDAPWYEEFVKANHRYEEFLSKNRQPGEYRLPFGKHQGKKLSEITDSYRYWAISPDRAGSAWYQDFVAENTRYEEYLKQNQEPAQFAFPWGHYKGKPLKDVPQGNVWFALHPRNSHYPWYQRLFDVNKRYLDQYFSTRSPGSVEIWFGKCYRGHRLDEVYQRRGYINYCLDPQRKEANYYHRLSDLVHRYEARLAESRAQDHPRRPRRAPHIENPRGEPVGPWDDSQGSAGEDDDYERDDFVCSDSQASYADDDDDDEGSTYFSTEEGEDDSMAMDVDEPAQDNEVDRSHADEREDAEDDMPLDVLERRPNGRNVEGSSNATEATQDSDYQPSENIDSNEDGTLPAPPRNRRFRNPIESDAEDDPNANNFTALGRDYRVPRPREDAL